MKNLIISDNAFLSEQIHEINQKLGLSDEFHWYHSKGSNSTFPSIFMGKLDLKSEHDVSFIKAGYTRVFSIHCKQLFPPTIIDNIPCFNLHPGYNPLNRGWYPQVFAIIDNLDIGATLHLIDNELDHGAIIERKKLVIPDYATSKDVYDMVLDLELELWESNIQSIIKNNYNSFYPEEEGKVKYKSDFNELLELNPKAIGTLKDHIDLLRALTHPPYKNAFLRDKTGRKYFVRIHFEAE